MDKRLVFAIAVVVIIFVVTWFSGYGELGGRIVSAIDGVSSYRVSTEVSVRTQGTANGRPVDLVEEIHAIGATDVSGKKMMMSATVEGGQGSVDSIMMYLIGDTIHVKSKGQWIIQKVPADYDVWGRQYQLRQLSRMINESNLNVLSREGDSMLVEIKPSRSRLLDYIREQSVSAGYPLSSSDDIGKTLKDVRMNVSVDGKTMLPKEFRMSTVVERDGITRTTETVMKTWDYGNPMEISLPEELSAYNLTQQAS